MVEVAGGVLWVRGVSCDILPSGEGWVYTGASLCHGPDFTPAAWSSSRLSGLPGDQMGCLILFDKLLSCLKQLQWILSFAP